MRSSVERLLSHELSEETRYRLLKYLAEHPDASQRDLASALGISLGKVNYCLRALVEKGLLKARNFRSSHRKSAYAYVLTPRGIEEKVQVTYAFLRRKLEEYDALAGEIQRLSAEVRDIETFRDTK
jgi:MarR family transcriptional regulator, temperature-dependent positive regulator of motility